LAVRAAKELIIRGSEMSLEDGLRIETRLIDYLFTTEDHKEARQAFIEKRKAIFKRK